MLKPVTPDPERCQAVGNVLGTLAIRKNFFERPFITVRVPEETRLSMLFNAVAICHQTHQLRSKKLNLSGWDYMEAAFMNLAVQGSWMLHPEAVVRSSETNLKNALLQAFSDNNEATDSTLDRIEERVELYLNLNTIIVNHFQGKLSCLLSKSNGLLLHKGEGFYEVLSKIQAFADPLRKKSSFLFKLLYDSGLFNVNDPGNFIPIMDYHMQRVLLRMGCLTISDLKLEEKLLSGTELLHDEPVRSGCIEALELIARHSGHPPWVMNDFLWPLGRSCCNETTLCIDHRCMKTPCTFEQMVAVPDHHHCVFEACCRGYNDLKYRSFREPNVKTHYY